MRADAKPCTKTGIAYIPLYTLSKRRISAIASASPKFSKEEHENFEKCYEAGANSDNSRYQMWLKMYKRIEEKEKENQRKACEKEERARLQFSVSCTCMYTCTFQLQVHIIGESYIS